MMGDLYWDLVQDFFVPPRFVTVRIMFQLFVLRNGFVYVHKAIYKFDFFKKVFRPVRSGSLIDLTKRL